MSICGSGELIVFCKKLFVILESIPGMSFFPFQIIFKLFWSSCSMNQSSTGICGRANHVKHLYEIILNLQFEIAHFHFTIFKPNFENLTEQNNNVTL